VCLIKHLGGAQGCYQRPRRSPSELNDPIGEKKRAPVVPGKDDCAGASLLAFLDKIRIRESFTLVSRLELLRELVVAHTAGVDNQVGRQAVLSTSSP
jgi:hypothetical protein